MSIELAPEEMFDNYPVFDACPECGHAWPDGIPEHSHDCRFFRGAVDEEDADAGWQAVKDLPS